MGNQQVIDSPQPLNQILGPKMRIAADGYISTLEEANKALAECVNGALEEMERLQKVNKEIARAAEVMAQISKTLE